MEDLTIYVICFCLTLFLLFLWKSSPKSFGAHANYAKIPGWTDLPYFGYLVYLTAHWDTMAIEFLKITRSNNWKTWIARAPSLGALGGGLVVLTNEENVRHVLSKNFENYVKGNEFQAWLSEFLGHGVFASDGAIWKHHRKIASHMFSRRLLRHTLAVGYDVGLNMIARLKTLIGGKKNEKDGTVAIDVQDVFFRFTIDIFTLVAFGVELHSFERDDQHPFAKAFDDIQRNVIYRVPNPCWRISKCLGLSKVEKAIHSSATIIDNFADSVISNKRRDKKKININGNEELGPDLISRFLQDSSKKINNDDSIAPITNKELRDIVLNFMIAGRDTTACALTWCIYELSKHPKYGTLIRNETIKENILSTNENDDPHDEKIAKDRYAALTRMKFTEAFIFETLRLHPSVPIDIKYSVNEDTLPDGTYVPPGVLVCYSPYVLGRNPKVWNKYNVDQFYPERWLERTNLPSEYAYPHFNAGKRICLGKGLAMLEIKLGLAMILNEFDVPIPKWDGHEANKDVPYQMTLTHPTKYGLHVGLKLREKKDE